MASSPTSTVLLPSKEPSNKNIQPQRPFQSTKKKSKKPTVRISKPTVQQKENLCDALLASESNVSIYTTSGIMNMLVWFCNEPVALRATQLRTLIRTSDLLESVSDEVLDSDISSLKSYFTQDAWDTLQLTVKQKKS